MNFAILSYAAILMISAYRTEKNGAHPPLIDGDPGVLISFAEAMQ